MKFWNLKKNDEQEQRAELYIYGDIEATSFWGDEITPDTLVRELAECSGPLDVYINSGGGDVFAGQTIYNILKRYDDEIIAHIDGLAASIASVIAMAGDKIIMPENAMMMIHNAWTIAAGNASDMRRTADELERVDGVIRDVYVARSGQKSEDIAAMMDAETWFTAAEALAAGLVDEVEANKAMAASINGNTLTINGQQMDLGRYAHADKVRDMIPETDPEPEPDNGGESQPVEDNALDEQRRQFDALRRKIIETTN